MPHATEASRQNVEKEPAQEIGRLEPKDSLLAAVSVVSPADAHDAVAHPEQSVIRERDPMGVPRQVRQDVARAIEWLLGVHHPLPLPELMNDPLGIRIQVYVRGAAKEVQVLAAKHP